MKVPYVLLTLNTHVLGYLVNILRLCHLVRKIEPSQGCRSFLPGLLDSLLAIKVQVCSHPNTYWERKGLFVAIYLLCLEKNICKAVQVKITLCG